MPKLHLITYGCQMNEYDSERVAGLLKTDQYELCDKPEDADVILLNTCSIREKAEDKVFSQLGALKGLKKARPDLVIGVMGCMAQLQQGRIQERAPYVDLVFGSPAIARVGQLVGRVRQGERQVLDTGEGALVKITAKPDAASRLKAFVTVMEGCEKNCTFCVVPVTRGRERSHAPDAIVEEIRGLAASGCREVTLLGQTVNAYGRDLDPPTDLASLLERVDGVEGIERIRFTTSNPYNLTTRLIRAIRDVPKVVEYLHLPVQSGSDRILARMHRGYTVARYLELIDEIKGTVPDIALSTDIIVGFPGETDADFAETVDVVERVAYDNAFVFRYSRRPGTPAADMSGSSPRRGEGRAQCRAARGLEQGRGSAEPSPRRPRPARPRRWGVAKGRARGIGADAMQPRREFRRAWARASRHGRAGADHRGAAAQPPWRAGRAGRGRSLGGMPCGSR